MFRILLLMILCHIVDDFVAQPVCLAKLKQRQWWIDNGHTDHKYKDDYKIALLIHSISWSIMVHLPWLFVPTSDLLLLLSVAANTVIHYITDDMKANKLMLNLEQDQLIHFTQILATFTIFSLF